MKKVVTAKTMAKSIGDTSSGNIDSGYAPNVGQSLKTKGEKGMRARATLAPPANKPSDALNNCVVLYRESWKALAAGKGPAGAGGQHMHLQFCNMIVNDSTYLLGEALEKLPQVRSYICRTSQRPGRQRLPPSALGTTGRGGEKEGGALST